MTLQESLKRLESLGSDKMRAHNRKHGAGENQFGVKMGDIRSLAKEIGSDHALGLELWATGNLDAQFLGILLLKPKQLTAAEIDRMVREAVYVNVADWFISYVIKPHPDKETLRVEWMQESHPMAARAGWSLTAERAARAPQGLDLSALLDRIESEMAGAAPEVQWTMNFALAETGIHHPVLRERAMQIGEKLGIYRDYPTSKGCTSPFAPIWISAMVARQK